MAVAASLFDSETVRLRWVGYVAFNRYYPRRNRTLIAHLTQVFIVLDTNCYNKDFEDKKSHSLLNR